MKKKRYIIITSVLVILAAAIFVLARLNAPQVPSESGSIAIVKDGDVLKTYTLDDIEAMDYVEADVSLSSSSFDNVEGTFRGVPVRALLNDADASLLEGASQIVAQAEDNYVTAFSAEEAVEDDSIIIAYSMDGKGLGTMDGGGTGPFRLIVMGDEFANRSVRWLTIIEVR